MFEKINPIAYSQKDLTPIAYRSSKVGIEVAESVMRSVSDLIDDEAYLPFFFKRLYGMGVPRFMQFADRARKGKYPKRLFAKLLKENASIPNKD